MARTFVRLKLRLLRNSLRIGQAAFLFSAGAVGGAWLALTGFTVLAAARGDTSAPDLAIVVFGIATLGWCVFPILGFGNDETLDPQRVATLPLSRRQLVSGVLAASLVGVGPAATLIAFSGALAGFAYDVTSAVLIVLAVLGSLLLCVTASRTIVALLVPVLRSRRGRDFVILMVTLLGLMPPLLELFATRGGHHEWRRSVVRIAERVRLTPFAWGGSAVAAAARGHDARALGFLAATAVLVALLLWTWSHALERSLTTADVSAASSANPHGRALPGLFPRALSFLPRTRAGAFAAKDLRYYARDPRRRAPLIGALIVPAVALSATLSQNSARSSSTTLLALVAVLPAAGLTLNQLGLDGAPLWAAVAAGNDPRADLTGKNLASVIVMVPLVTLSALICAMFTGGWSYLPLTLGLAPAIFGVLLGVGDVMSVRVPYAMPDRRNPLAFTPGQGCITLLAGIAALAVQGVLLVPLVVVAYALVAGLPLAVATVLTVLVANAYGGAIWLWGRRVEWRDAWWRLPELLEAVSPRQAA